MSLYVKLSMQEIADGLTAIGWSGAGGGGDASLSYGATAPLSPTNGTLWYDTTVETLKIWNSVSWVNINVTQSVINNINAQVTLAQTYSQDAQEALAGFTSIVATATTLAPEASATATFNAGTGVLTLGVPKGAQGIQGVSISTITRTIGDGSAGTTDTYTITFSDASTSTFNVYNGADGAVMSVAGRTGDVVLAKADVGLSNVDNTSDTDKPISTATQAALNEKADTTHSHTSFTGLTVTGLKETSVAMPANDIDLATGNLFTKTISGATTLTVSNVPTSGTVGYFILQLTNGGAGVVTYPSGTKWSKGTAPTLTASGIDLLRFVTIDGGTRWEASRIQEDSK